MKAMKSLLTFDKVVQPLRVVELNLSDYVVNELLYNIFLFLYQNGTHFISIARVTSRELEKFEYTTKILSKRDKTYFLI